jgi:hypothetical protein
MRDSFQEILYNVTGQSLIFEAPEGRPSSVTSVTVYLREQDDTGSSEFTATGTVDSVNTTLTAAAGPSQSDPKAIAVTSGSSIAARRAYLVTAAGGESEWIECASVSGTSVVSRLPLVNDFATGATFQSTRITAPVDATWVASQNKISGETGTITWNEPPNDTDNEPWYRCAWVYVVGGVTYKHETRLDLVRYTAGHLITPVDVDRRFPGWLDRIPVDYRRDQGRPLVDEAFRLLKTDLLVDGHLARWVRRHDIIGELVIYRAQWVATELAVMHGADRLEALAASEKAYKARFDQLIREPNIAIGSSPGGAITGGRPISPLIRR